MTCSGCGTLPNPAAVLVSLEPGGSSLALTNTTFPPSTSFGRVAPVPAAGRSCYGRCLGRKRASVTGCIRLRACTWWWTMGDPITDPITTQGEALRLWPDEGVALLWGWRGASHCSIDHRTVYARVWERLLDRGDLLLHEDRSDPNRAPTRTLYLSPQGRKRAEEWEVVAQPIPRISRWLTEEA